MEQHELTLGPLLDEKGNLNEAGFSYSLVKTYDRKAVKANKLRLKEWDYYYVGSKDVGFAFTIDDNGYMDLCSASLLFLAAPAHKAEAMVASPLSLGKRRLPSTSLTGDTFYKTKKVAMSFRHENGKRHLMVTWPDFTKGKDLAADIVLETTTDKTMVIATPFKKDKHFYYNQKINNLKASGWVRYGNDLYDLSKGDFYGVLDWGRGVWTYQNTCYWSSLNASQDGHTIGWNLGYGFGDTSKASENMLFVDKDAYKLNDVTFQIPKGANGKDDFLSPWKFVSQSGDIDLTFTPVLDRAGGANLLLLKSNQHQVFGRFIGTFQVAGKTIGIHDLPGFAEKVFNRW
jgi:hypothetical protein